MATLTATGLTLVEIAKRHGPDGNLITIAEVLQEENEILQDMLWAETNEIFANVSTIRSSLPTGSWRKLNAGTAAEKSDTRQSRDPIGILETWAISDKDLVDAAANPKQLRNDEARAFLEGLSQTMAETAIYGNTTTAPEQFMGLAPRMASLATTANVLNAGGSGSDLTSIYVVDWGLDKVFMGYPRGSKAGLQHNDMGVERVTDASGNSYLAYVDHFQWKAGMVVKNTKSIGRIANIESAGAANIFDEDDLITLLNRMTKGAGLRIYCNETIKTQAEIRLKDKANVNWSVADGLGGTPLLRFRGVPVRMVDQIVNTEATLT